MSLSCSGGELGEFTSTGKGDVSEAGGHYQCGRHEQGAAAS